MEAMNDIVSVDALIAFTPFPEMLKDSTPLLFVLIINTLLR
jgi:hypothetical protein